MGKKRSREAAKAAPHEDELMGESDEEDFDIVNVEFEWFNFDADIDFHGTKTLLRQLLDVDNTLFNMSGLADCILAQSTIGSTVKVDGKANDAYALLTALSLREQRANPAVATLTAYLAEKAATNDALAPLVPLLEQQATGSGAHIGLILSERLINMPAEIAPPLYSMLIDEVEAAVEDGEPYAFTHYLILSRTYKEVQSDLMMVMEEDDDDNEAPKKKKKGQHTKEKKRPAHRDEVMRKHAVASGTFQYTKVDEATADSKRAFQDLGVQSQGLLMLVEAGKLPGAVKAISEYVTSQ